MAEGDGAFEAQKLTITPSTKAPEVDFTEFRFTALDPSSKAEDLGFGAVTLTDTAKQAKSDDTDPKAAETFTAVDNAGKPTEKADVRDDPQADKMKARTDVRAGDPSGPGGEAQEPRENFKATTPASAKQGGIAAGLDGATQSPLKSPGDNGYQNQAPLETGGKIDTWAPSIFDAQPPAGSMKPTRDDQV